MMKLKRVISVLMAAAITLSVPVFAQAEEEIEPMVFNFTSQYIEGAKKVRTVEKI